MTRNEGEPEEEEAQPTPSFKLSVWRPARRHRLLSYYRTSQNEGSTSRDFLTLEQDELLEEIYTWDPGASDVWASALTGDAIRKASQKMVSDFSPLRAPEERGLDRFRVAITELRSAAMVTGATSWAATADEVEPPHGKRILLRTNSLLSLVEHLLWVTDTFQNVPGASVTLR